MDVYNVHSVHNIQIGFMYTHIYLYIFIYLYIPFRVFSNQMLLLFLELSTKAVKLNFIAIQFQLDQCHLNNHSIVRCTHGVCECTAKRCLITWSFYQTNIFIRKRDLCWLRNTICFTGKHATLQLCIIFQDSKEVYMFYIFVFV